MSLSRCTNSLYVPAAKRMVSPSAPAVMADVIVSKVPIRWPVPSNNCTFCVKSNVASEKYSHSIPLSVSVPSSAAFGPVSCTWLKPVTRPWLSVDAVTV